jgi:pentatricopeptide repeat protein
MHLAGSSISDIDRAVDLLYRIGPDALEAPSKDGSSVSNARLLEVLFNTLLDACITVRDLDRMTKIFVIMQEFKVSVSAVTYGTLIKAYGQAGRLSRCHEIWKDMHAASIRPTIVTYGCYIDACIRNNSYELAEEVFGSMTKSPHGVKPNAVIYTSLIRGCAHAKQPRRALELYRRMQQDGIEATSVTFNSVLDIVARQIAEPSVLQEIIDDMCKTSIVPDVVTYSILMKASCSCGNVQTALSLFRQIQDRGIEFDQAAFNTLLLACSKADQVADAEDIFEQMHRSGLAPTHVTTSIMVKMYGKAKTLDKAIALTKLLEDKYGQKPNLYVYTCLIQACVQNNHVRRSWDIFNNMISSGVEPDAITYGTVIHGCIYLNKFSYAMNLVRHAYQRTNPVDASSPFLTASPLKHAVPLQHEVLQMLLAALQRKDEHGLHAELQEIMAENAVVSRKSTNYPKNAGKKSSGRGHM